MGRRHRLPLVYCSGVDINGGGIAIKSAKQLQRFRLRGGESVREGARAQMSRIAGCDNSASAG